MNIMREIYKKFFTFLPLMISIFVLLTYFGMDVFILQEKEISWRPYITFGTLIIGTLGQVCFFLFLSYNLLRDLKNRKTWMKIVHLATVLVVGIITFYVAMWGSIFSSLTYVHEKVVKTDDTSYVSCLSDWNPIYYHYYEYDSWFTMAAEPFKSIKAEDVHY